MASVSSPETRATRAKRIRDEQLAELVQLRAQQADRARKFATRFASKLADVVGSPAAEMDDAAAQDACAGMLTVAQDMIMAEDTTPADRTEALGFLGDREGSPENFFFGEDRSREDGLTPAYHLLSGGVAALRKDHHVMDTQFAILEDDGNNLLKAALRQ